MNYIHVPKFFERRCGVNIICMVSLNLCDDTIQCMLRLLFEHTLDCIICMVSLNLCDDTIQCMLE